MTTILNRFTTLLALMFLPVCACAQNTQLIHFSIGTGFFINTQGYLLTNAHVIGPCQRYSVYGRDATMQATLVAMDKEHDLALLKATFSISEIGRFNSFNPPPQIGEDVIIMGYPESAWQKRKPVVRTAKLLALEGPIGEKKFLQFSDSVAEGNSGGPLLDSSGNIIGVVTAKSTLTKVNAETNAVLSVKHVDVGINLSTVERFLKNAGVEFHHADSRSILPQSRIIEKASGFIVNIRCRVD